MGEHGNEGEVTLQITGVANNRLKGPKRGRVRTTGEGGGEKGANVFSYVLSKKA